jgi:organic radical activating enzyme
MRQRSGDELKVVYVGQDLSMYDDLKQGFTHLYLQPCYDHSQNLEVNGQIAKETFGICMANPEWHLSIQTHKWLGVD